MSDEQKFAENLRNRIVRATSVSLDSHDVTPRNDSANATRGAREQRNDRIGSEGFRGIDALAKELLAHENTCPLQSKAFAFFHDGVVLLREQSGSAVTVQSP